MLESEAPRKPLAIPDSAVPFRCGCREKILARLAKYRRRGFQVDVMNGKVKLPLFQRRGPTRRAALLSGLKK
jgi:hypothetical protein